MNSQHQSSSDRKLGEWEREVRENRSERGVEPPQSWQPLRPDFEDARVGNGTLPPILERVTNWYDRLPNAGKIAVAIVAAIAGFSLLKSILQLMASLFTLAILGGILYLMYRFVIVPQSSK
jgi:hypothetical protein